ncbi:30S ribosomal protein S2 [Candidatus Giovannonibacteria bacterium]|nr:30S ribosomal protein S2 [Candidatus Giovannonibacteria bacterium]
MAEILAKGDNPELETMFSLGVQFGYSRSRRHPKMAAYIHGIKNNIEIFDLEMTSEALDKAKVFLKKLGESRKNILFVGTKPSSRAAVEKYAKSVQASYVAGRWIGGTLTNAKIIRDRIKYFEDLKRKKETGELEKYTKKEKLRITREIKTLEEKFSGIENLKNDLGAVIMVDPREEKTAFAEAKKVLVPIIAILSSDNNPSGIAYPIPANDSASTSIEYLLRKLAEGYREGLMAPDQKNV